MSYAAYQQPYGQPPPSGQWGAPPVPQHPPQQGYGYGYNQAPPTPQSPYPSAPQGHSPYPPYAQPPPHIPAQGYGAPSYGPPPVELYGSPVPAAPHGYHNQAPPSGPPPAQYGAPPLPPSPMPPYGASPQYGAPMSSYPTPCSPGYERPPRQINWDANPTANALRKAMKGFGTDEKALIRELADKDPYQIRAINDAYRTSHRRNLVADIEGETSSWFQEGLVQIARGPLMADVWLVHKAMKGAGTKEKLMNDVLLGRSNADINSIKAAYHETYGKGLEAAVRDDLSLKTERHFDLVLSAQRAEDSAPVIPAEVERDVDALYTAMEAHLTTDEIRVCSILSTRNDNQISAIAAAYERRYARQLDAVIIKKFRGHMEEALIFQLRQARNKPKHQLDLILEAMAGLGTKDYLLVSRVVRLHWDKAALNAAKELYRQLNRGKTLGQRIREDVGSSDYQRLMLACIGEPR